MQKPKLDQEAMDALKQLCQMFIQRFGREPNSTSGMKPQLTIGSVAVQSNNNLRHRSLGAAMHHFGCESRKESLDASPHEPHFATCKEAPWEFIYADGRMETYHL
jgi:hypothetical protein